MVGLVPPGSLSPIRGEVSAETRLQISQDLWWAAGSAHNLPGARVQLVKQRLSLWAVQGWRDEPGLPRAAWAGTGWAAAAGPSGSPRALAQTTSSHGSPCQAIVKDQRQNHPSIFSSSVLECCLQLRLCPEGPICGLDPESFSIAFSGRAWQSGYRFSVETLRRAVKAVVVPAAWNWESSG